jgi:hypothetical protein
MERKNLPAPLSWVSVQDHQLFTHQIVNKILEREKTLKKTQQAIYDIFIQAREDEDKSSFPFYMQRAYTIDPILINHLYTIYHNTDREDLKNVFDSAPIFSNQVADRYYFTLENTGNTYKVLNGNQSITWLKSIFSDADQNQNALVAWCAKKMTEIWIDNFFEISLCCFSDGIKLYIGTAIDKEVFDTDEETDKNTYFRDIYFQTDEQLLTCIRRRTGNQWDLTDKIATY